MIFPYLKHLGAHNPELEFTSYEFCYSLYRRKNVNDVALDKGWYSSENWGTWSREKAIITVPYSLIKQECSKGKVCQIGLKYLVFGGSPDAPKTLIFKHNGQIFNEEILNDQSTKSTFVDISDHQKLQEEKTSFSIELEVVGAVSPYQLKISSDKRILGVGLYQISFRNI